MNSKNPKRKTETPNAGCLQQPCSATPREQLIQELMDSRIPKNEREWCASRKIEDMLNFIREQVELWDGNGDSGFPLYEHGKKILARYKTPNDQAEASGA
jgi:hypothetical protein